MIHLVYGAESYCVDYMRKKLSDVEQPSVNRLVAATFSEDVVSFLETVSFTMDKKVAVLDVKDLETLPSEFQRYLKNPSSDNDLVIVAEKVDERKSLFKEMAASSAVKIHKKDKVSSEEVDKILLREVKMRGAEIKEDAFLELKRRYGYADNDSVTIWSMVNGIRNLCDLSKEITIENVVSIVPENFTSQVFVLASLIRKKNYREIKKQVEKLNEEGFCLGAIGALLREVRISYKQVTGCTLSEIGAKKPGAFASFGEKTLREMLSACLDGKDAVKKGIMAEETILLHTVERLCAAI